MDYAAESGAYSTAKSVFPSKGIPTVAGRVPKMVQLYRILHSNIEDGRFQQFDPVIWAHSRVMFWRLHA
jgi:hypothetical protein